MSNAILFRKSSRFDRVLTSVESLPVEDQAILVEVIAKRVTARRRQRLLQEVAHAREEYRQGRIRRGTAAELMQEVRAK